MVKMNEEQLTSLVNELNAKLDICYRYATGELEDQSLLANDYGGTGWESDERVVAVKQALRTADKDRQRMDWLETQQCWTGVRGKSEPSPRHTCGGGYADTVREVCDKNITYKG